MSDEDDPDPMSHAADEPTAMWGGDMLEELGLDRPPSEPPHGAAQPAQSKRSSVQVTLGDSPAGSKKAAPPSQAVQWAVLIVGALVLAAAAFFIVRALR